MPRKEPCKNTAQKYGKNKYHGFPTGKKMRRHVYFFRGKTTFSGKMRLLVFEVLRFFIRFLGFQVLMIIYLNAKDGRFVHVAPKHVFLSATPQLLCDNAKITNFLLFCKKIPYYMGLEGIKNKKFRYYFHKYGQIRISTHFLALSLHRLIRL